MSEKNYDEKAVARLHEVYDGEASVEDRDAQVAALAAELGKTSASVRSKLVAEGIYKAKTEVEKGKRGVTKADLVAKIASALEIDEDVAGSLEKANKSILTRVLGALSK